MDLVSIRVILQQKEIDSHPNGENISITDTDIWRYLPPRKKDDDTIHDSHKKSVRITPQIFGYGPTGFKVSLLQRGSINPII